MSFPLGAQAHLDTEDEFLTTQARFWASVSPSKTHLNSQMIIIGNKLLFDSQKVVEEEPKGGSMNISPLPSLNSNPSAAERCIRIKMPRKVHVPRIPSQMSARAWYLYHHPYSHKAPRHTLTSHFLHLYTAHHESKTQGYKAFPDAEQSSKYH